MRNKHEVLFFITTLLVVLFAGVMFVGFVVGELQNSGLIEALASHRTTLSGTQ